MNEVLADGHMEIILDRVFHRDRVTGLCFKDTAYTNFRKFDLKQ